MLCNTKKTCCMVFKHRNNKFFISENFKRLLINNVELEYVNSFNYLGHIINDKLCDDDDISREVRRLVSGLSSPEHACGIRPWNSL